MARYTGADCKRCRREKQKLFLKGSKCESAKCPIEIRPYPPGEHGRGRTKDSEYLLQLREKQKCARIYGVLEKQFRGYYKEANKKSGKTGENLLRILETRLDNVVYRAGFAKSRDHARQLVRHGHITVNGRKTDIPSARVAVSDIIEVRERSRNLTPFRWRRPRPATGPCRRGWRPSRASCGSSCTAARAPGDRHPGAGAADRRALLEVVRAPTVRAVRSRLARRAARTLVVLRASNSGRPRTGGPTPC